MFLEFFRKLDSRRFDLYRDEVRHRNQEALRSYLVLGVLVTVANFLSQVFLIQTVTFTQVIILLVYYGILGLFSEWIVKSGREISSTVMYLTQIPVMLLGILMGTVLDPDNAAITFLLFIVTMPMFILDKPWRVVLYETILSAIFVVCAAMSKPVEIFRLDMVHLIVFYVAAVAMTLFTLIDRIESVEAHVRVFERSEHDELTGLKNRFALRVDFDSYIDKQLCVMMSDIDKFKTFNDLYGHQTGDEVLAWFAKVFEGEFGVESCYRYGGDELLLIVEGENPAVFEERLKQCQKRLSAGPSMWSRSQKTIACSCGFAYGMPQTSEELRQMITTADHCLYEVKDSGRGGIISKEYIAELYVPEEIAE